MTPMPFTAIIVILGMLLGLVAHAIYSDTPFRPLWASLCRWAGFRCPHCPGRMCFGVWTRFCDRCDYWRIVR